MERNPDVPQSSSSLAGSGSSTPARPANPAQVYEQRSVPHIFVPWSKDLLARATPRPGERVLDIACGTGIIARPVVPLVGPTGTVVGADISPAMLAVAQEIAPQVDWHEASADALPFPDASFDLAFCKQGFQFFPDRPAAAREMHRVLGPGGRLALSVWRGLEHNPVQQILNDVGSRHLGAPLFGPAFSMGDPSTLHAPLGAAGFQDVRVEPVTLSVRFPSPDQFLKLTILSAAAVVPALAQLSDAERTALVSAIEADAAPGLAPYRDGDALVWPMAAHVALAIKH